MQPTGTGIGWSNPVIHHPKRMMHPGRDMMPSESNLNSALHHHLTAKRSKLSCVANVRKRPSTVASGCERQGGAALER